jgi:trans-2,3-dihydro-3-hydroxyanthranilate isomerase
VPIPISIVHACLRDGRGGSPTAIVDDTGLTDDERSEVPIHAGTSHAVFITDASTVDLRFFTAHGELPACGHGTVAALAYLAAHRSGPRHEFTLRVSGRTFTGRAVRDGPRVHTAFDPGPVVLRDPTPAETALVLAALGIPPDLVAPGACVASVGRARILLPLSTPEAVAGVAPDLDQVRAACDKLGLLGCYVHSTPTSAGRVTARMFAPSIGVPEDIANANSTACLAANLATTGITDLTVDMGDTLGCPATITTAAQFTPSGPTVLVGGAATIIR